MSRTAEKACSATPTLSWWSADVGSLKSFNAGRLGYSTVAGLDRIPAQEAEDSGSNRAEFQVDLRMRGLRFPLLLCMSYLLFRCRRAGDVTANTRSRADELPADFALIFPNSILLTGP
jgi:hypothetical protein